MNGPHINTKGEFDHTATDYEQECEGTARGRLDIYLDRQA